MLSDYSFILLGEIAGRDAVISHLRAKIAAAEQALEAAKVQHCSPERDGCHPCPDPLTGKCWCGAQNRNAPLDAALEAIRQ
jgi:hypothetical protein